MCPPDKNHWLRSAVVLRGLAVPDLGVFCGLQTPVRRPTLPPQRNHRDDSSILSASLRARARGMLHWVESRSDLRPGTPWFNAGKWRPELSRVGPKAERQPGQLPSPRRTARLQTGGMTLSRPGRVNGQTNTNPTVAAGIAVPDTKLATEATEVIRDTTTELIYHHSHRVYWFGSLLGRN